MRFAHLQINAWLIQSDTTPFYCQKQQLSGTRQKCTVVPGSEVVPCRGWPSVRVVAIRAHTTVSNSEPNGSAFFVRAFSRITLLPPSSPTSLDISISTSLQSLHSQLINLGICIDCGLCGIAHVGRCVILVIPFGPCISTYPILIW